MERVAGLKSDTMELLHATLDQPFYERVPYVDKERVDSWSLQVA